MADITTVGTSVGLTLALQGIYYLAMKFPDQMHRNSATLFKLETEENTTYLISQISLQESKKAFEVYAPWREQLYALSTEKNSSEPPQNLLGDNCLN